MGIKSLTMLSRIIDVKKSRKGFLPANLGKPNFEYVSQSRPLIRDIPENQGISSRDIADFLEELHRDETLNIHNVLIIRNEKLIAEAYFGAQRKDVWKATFSACKSIVSIAIGMLIDEGKLKLDTKLSDIFKKEMSSVSKLKMRDMTVYHLLTMTSGMTSYEEIAAICEGTSLKTYFNTSLSFAPGEKFSYNSTNTYVLSAILKKISGEGLCDYLESRLFEPLGIENYYWEKSEDDIEIGGWGLYISPEDIAKLGILLLNGGEWKGKRIISQEYIKMATENHVGETGSKYGFGYGLQMWTASGSDEFLFNGMLGQNVWGFKKNNILIVNNSGNDELFHQSNYFAIVEKYFRRELPQQRIKRDGKGYRRLCRTVKEIAQNPVLTTATKREVRALYRGRLPRECRDLDGLRLSSSNARCATIGIMPLVWQTVENNYSNGLVSLSFKLENKKIYLKYEQTDEEYLIAIGFGAPEYTNIYIHNAPYLVAASGAFAFDEDGRQVLKIRIDFVETPCSTVLKLVYHDGYFVLRQREIPGKTFVFERSQEVKKDFSKKPIVGGVASFLEDDILEYRIERLFEFDVVMKREEEKSPDTADITDD